MSWKKMYSGVCFAVVLAMHLGFFLWQGLDRAGKWLQNVSMGDLFHLYISQQDYFLGLSYALAAGFTVYSFLTFLKNKKAGVHGLLGGMTLTGLLYFGGCFLVGCCGSPMLPIYLGLFGSSFLGFGKPIIFGVTILSVGLGFWYLKRKSTISCCK